jgi:hypothetical protein
MEGEKRAFGRNQSIRDQAVKMGMEAGGVIAIVMFSGTRSCRGPHGGPQRLPEKAP